MSIAGIDVADFFPADLTVPASVSIPGGAGYLVRGILDRESEDVDIGGHGVLGSEITFEAPAEQMPGIVERANLEIGGVDYTVLDVVDDGAGAVALLLQEVLA